MSVQVTARVANEWEVSATVTVPGRPTVTVTIAANAELVKDATPWQAAALPIAMWTGAPLVIDGLVDDIAAANADRAQDVLRGLHTKLLQKVPIHTDGTTLGEPSTGVGCFFSGGVDSFYSALTHADEITHLIFVTGFDIDIADDSLAAAALAGAAATAAGMGKELIAVKTTLKQLANGSLDWGLHYHGAALAAVGLALSPILGRIFIPGTYHRDDQVPWGTHLDLDHWWSSSRVTFEHDGVDVTRAEKVRAIAVHPLALDHLRVCWENRGGAFNCGRCEKCLRTMISLHIVDALQHCKTLPALSPREVRRMRLYQDGTVFRAMENLAELRRLPHRDRALERAVQQAVLIQRVRAPLGVVRRRLVAAARRR